MTTSDSGPFEAGLLRGVNEVAENLPGLLDSGTLDNLHVFLADLMSQLSRACLPASIDGVSSLSRTKVRKELAKLRPPDVDDPATVGNVQLSEVLQRWLSAAERIDQAGYTGPLTEEDRTFALDDIPALLDALVRWLTILVPYIAPQDLLDSMNDTEGLYAEAVVGVQGGKNV